MKFSFRQLLVLTLLGQLVSCSSDRFVKEEVCSPSSLAYLKSTRDREHGPQMLNALEHELLASKKEIQKCYDDYYDRTGIAEFQTCLVVGVDVTGMLDFYQLSSREIYSDSRFVKCAEEVTKKIPWWKYGTNYTVLQTYRFREN